MARSRAKKYRATCRLGPLSLEPLESRRMLALTASLVSDVNPGPNGSDPADFTGFFNQQLQVIFTADDGSTGRELWRSDATSGGTTQIADIRSGALGSDPTALNVARFTVVIPATQIVYFVADDGMNGRELWRTDGRGATLVADIREGALGSDILEIATFDAYAFVGANDGNLGAELWASSGTRDTPAPEGGAQLVKDIRLGALSSTPRNFAERPSDVLFTADDGEHGEELWQVIVTNTVDAVRRTDINPGPASSDIDQITFAINDYYFVANNGTNGRELWRYNTNLDDFQMVKDIVAGVGSSDPQNLVNVNGTIYFTADDGTSGRELWVSNGTAIGTRLVKDIVPGGTGSDPQNLVNVSGTLFFTADDGTSGRELWKTDGTTGGTVLVADVDPSSTGSEPLELTNWNGTLFFTANDGANGREVWMSDGTSVGTVLVADIAPGAAGSDPKNLATVDGWLFFSADDGTNGAEPWTIRDVPQGQGNDTIGLYEPVTSTFFFKNANSPGPADGSVQYGAPGAGWLPLAGDWDSDGIDSFGLYDQMTGTFYLRNAHTPGPADVVVQFGPANVPWTPIAGDWDDDGDWTVGLYDPTDGRFYLKFDNTPGAADIVVQVGAGGEAQGVAGAWYEDRGTKIGLQDFTNSTIAELDGQAFQFIQGPFVPTLAMAGDWFDRGFDAMGRYEPDSGTFFLFSSSGPGPAEAVVQFGPSGDAGWLPIAGDWDGMTAGLFLQGNAAPLDPRLDLAPLGRDVLLDAVSTGLAHFVAAGLDPNRVAALANVTYQIVDLPGNALGKQSDGNIWIDYNGAGHGWFVNLSDDALVDADRFDLLSVVLHEMGHELGLLHLNEHADDPLMHSALELGTRITPSAEMIDELVAIE